MAVNNNGIDFNLSRLQPSPEGTDISPLIGIYVAIVAVTLVTWSLIDINSAIVFAVMIFTSVFLITSTLEKTGPGFSEEFNAIGLTLDNTTQILIGLAMALGGGVLGTVVSSSIFSVGIDYASMNAPFFAIETGLFGLSTAPTAVIFSQVLVTFSEEALFRSALPKLLNDVIPIYINPLQAGTALISSVAFSYMHFAAYQGNIAAFLAAFIFALFAYYGVRFAGGSLFASIGAHLMINLVSVGVFA